MPTVEGREARVWIDRYVKKSDKLSGTAKAAKGACKEYRCRMRRIRESVEDSVVRSEWAAVFLHGGERTCGFWPRPTKFMRGAILHDPGKLLEGTGKYLRHVKLRSAADVRRPGVRALVKEAAALNRKKPVTGTKVGMKKRQDRQAKEGLK